MQNGGFFEKRRTNSLGFGIVVAGHAILLTAIALNPTRYGPHIVFVPQLQDYRDPEPPPIDPPPPPEPKTRSEARPTQPDPLVDAGTGPKPFTFDPPLIDPVPIPLPQPIEPEFRQATMDPKASGRFQPPYPSAMVRAGIEGSVTVKVLIGTDGRVRAVELVGATNPAFFDTTRDHALRSWKFQPATRDGIATESWRTMTVKFRLES